MSTMIAREDALLGVPAGPAPSTAPKAARRKTLHSCAIPFVQPIVGSAQNLPLAIIGGKAVALEDADIGVEMPSLLIKMSEVFEAYLRNVLTAAAMVDPWGVRVLDGNKHAPAGAAKKNLLDSGVAHEATPDIVLTAGPTRQPDHRLLIEVKYKPAKSTVDRDDLNQTLAYGVSYRTPEVVVVQPRAGGSAIAGLRPLGSLAGMNVSLYVFDLDAADLLAEEQRFVDAVRARS